MNIIDVPWDEVRKFITPLDLVFFSGNDFVSSTICELQRQKLEIGLFSHVGIIVNSFVLPHVKELQPNELYVWESTSSLRLPGFQNEAPDVFGNHRIGVQIRNLKQVFESYNGGLYIGKLKNNPLYINYTEQNTLDKINDKIFLTQKQIEQQKKIFNYKDELNKILKEIKDLETSFDPIEQEEKSPTSSEDEGKDLILEQIIKIGKEFEANLQNKYIQINNRVYNEFKNSKEHLAIQKKIKIIYEIYGNKLYNASILDLFSALYPILRPLRSLKYKIIRKLAKLFKNKKNILATPVFCSQFVALIYNNLGIIDVKIDVMNFVPVDFLGCDEDGQPNIVQNIFKIVK
jgi:hypothetical protein